MGRVDVRPASRADRPALVALIRAYLDFYKAPQPDEARLQGFLDQLEANSSRGVQLVAEQDDRLVGFASLFASFDTLVAAEILVMNDLFVMEAQRRQGVGQALFDASRRYAAFFRNLSSGDPYYRHEPARHEGDVRPGAGAA